MGEEIWGKYLEPDVEAEINLVCVSHMVSGTVCAYCLAMLLSSVPTP